MVALIGWLPWRGVLIQYRIAKGTSVVIGNRNRYLMGPQSQHCRLIKKTQHQWTWTAPSIVQFCFDLISWLEFFFPPDRQSNHHLNKCHQCVWIYYASEFQPQLLLPLRDKTENGKENEKKEIWRRGATNGIQYVFSIVFFLRWLWLLLILNMAFVLNFIFY